MKKIYSVIMVIALLVSFNYPVFAKEEIAPFNQTITVAENGGRYQVGFITVEFKKDFLNINEPVTFDAQVYAENGLVYIEFSPNIPDFYKAVHLKVEAYNGTIYDRALGKDIVVQIKPQQILAEHFSRYCTNR